MKPMAENLSREYFQAPDGYGDFRQRVLEEVSLSAMVKGVENFFSK